MTRATQGNKSFRKHKKTLKKAKGYYGARSKTFRAACRAVIKASQSSYKDNKIKKRTFRSLWISRINAAARKNGLSYSKFIKLCKDNNVIFNRKILSEIAVADPKAFANIVKF